MIAGEEVLVVKGALGAMGAGNTSVLMQLLVGMLDAALARQQDLVAAEPRVAVALKVDEAPLVLNRGFAETMALKRSAGLETVACWQTDAQWADREVRDQLDALFAHRVYFATASARDARDAVRLTMAEFSDTVRPGIAVSAALGHPDVRLHLPRHHAIASWTTPMGRQAPFIAQTIPLRIDRERVALHASRQQARGGRYLADLRQPHWERRSRAAQPAAEPGRTRRAIRRRTRRSRSRGTGLAIAPPRATPGSGARAVAHRRASASWSSSTGRTACAGPDPRALQPLSSPMAGPRDARADRGVRARAQHPDPPSLQPERAPRRPSGVSSGCPTRASSSACSSIAATAAECRCATRITAAGTLR